LVAKSGSLSPETAPSGAGAPEEATAKPHIRLALAGPCLSGAAGANTVGGAARLRPPNV